MIEPKEIEIETQSHGMKKYVISKFDCISGREILVQYPTSALPKLGDYKLNQDLMFKLMSFVAVPLEGRDPMRLSTADLIKNHVPDWEALIALEKAMMEYNVSFFGNGKLLIFLKNSLEKIKGLASQMLTDLSAQSSAKKRQP